MTISINILYGSSYVTDDDIDRARAAALQFLEAAGYEPAEAYRVFCAEWAWLESDEAADQGRCQDYEYMWEPESVAWIEAERIAEIGRAHV